MNSMRIYVLVISCLQVWFLTMLALSLRLYVRRTAAVIGNRRERRIPFHVVLLLTSYILSICLTIAIEWIDYINNYSPMPPLVRWPWVTIATILGIGSLQYLFSFEIDQDYNYRDKMILQSQLAAIVESSEDGIVGKDIYGKVTSWNHGAEKLFGYSSQEMIGKPISTICPDDRVSEMDDVLKRIRRGERISTFVTTRKRKDGKIISVSLTISPIRDDLGRIVGASKIARAVHEKSTA